MFFIKKITAKPTGTVIKDLRVQLSIQPMAWLKKFQDNKGIDILLELLSKIDKKYRNKTEGFRLQNEVLRTFKVCLHSKNDVEYFVDDGSRLKKLILSIDAGDQMVRQLTYEILALIVLFSDEDPTFLIPAFDYLKFTRNQNDRFLTLIESLKFEASPELIANVLVLINSIVNTVEDLYERMALRIEFNALGLDLILNDLKLNYSKSKSSISLELLSQIETFESDLEQDEEEYSDQIKSNFGHEIDFKDPKQLFFGIMSHIKNQEHIHPPFYTLMKHLIEFPTDKTRGTKIWWFASKIIQQLSMPKDSFAFAEQNRTFDIEEILNSSTDKIDLENLREEKFVQIEKLKNEIEELKINLKKVEEKTGSKSTEDVQILQVAKLKAERSLEERNKELKQLKDKFEQEKNIVVLETKTLRSELFIFKEKNQNLMQQLSDIKDRLKDTRKTLDRTNSFNISADKEELIRNVNELQKENVMLRKSLNEEKKQIKKDEQIVDSEQIEKLHQKLNEAQSQILENMSLVNSQIEKEKLLMTQIELKEIEFNKLKQDNSVLKELLNSTQQNEQIKNQKNEEIKNAQPQNINSLPHSPTSPIPPPAPPLNFNGPPAPPSPVKKNSLGPKPNIPMKSLQWSKLSNSQASKSVFKEFDLSKVTLDTVALESLFAMKIIQSKPSTSKLELHVKKEQLISFLEPKRLTNIGIFIQSFKNNFREIAEAILMVNEEILTTDLVSKLIDNAPLEEETKSILNHVNQGAGLDQLQNVDRFFYQLALIPNLINRLQCISFKVNFEAKISELRVSALRVKKANKDFLNHNSTFKLLLEFILAIGNFMNNGNSKGNAIGFHLNSLLQLSSVKALNNKTTLLDYLVEFLQSKSEFSDILKLPQDLADLQLSTKINWNVLQGDLQDLQKGLIEVQNSAQNVSKSENKLDVFKEIIIPALENFSTVLANVESQFKEVDETYSKISLMFGFVDHVTPPEEFYGIIVSFLNDMEKSIKNTSIDKTKSEKENRRKKLEEQRKALEEKKKAIKIAKSPDLINQNPIKDEDIQSIVSNARSGSNNRFKKNLLRRQETLRQKRAQENLK